MSGPTPVRLIAPIAGVIAADVGAVDLRARAAPGGVATLDAGGKVPPAQLPVGTAAGTVASGADPRLTDARVPLAHTHPQSDVVGLVGELAARQNVTEKGTPGGYPGLDSGGRVPAAQLPIGTGAGTVASGADLRLTDARVPLAHTHPQSDVVGLAADLAARQLLSGKGTANGYAGLDANGRVPVAQLPVGASAGTVASGADPRLGDARVPLAHAASHALGGSDPLTVAALVGGAPATGDVLAWSGTTWTASGRLTAIEAAQAASGDAGLYGDLVSTTNRDRASGQVGFGAGYVVATMLAPRAVTVTKIRFHVASVAVLSLVAAPTLTLYAGPNTSAGWAALPRVATAPVAQSTFTSLGLKEFTLSTPVDLAAGARVAVLVYTPSAAFLVAAGLAACPTVPGGLLNPGPAVVAGSRSATVTGPATLDLTTGWSADTGRVWWALA